MRIKQFYKIARRSASTTRILPNLAGKPSAFIGWLFMSAFFSSSVDTAYAREALNSKVLEEVLVTARKKSESLQDTPIAVTAMSGEDLAEAGIKNISEITKSVPSLQINNSTGTQIFVRGIGQRSSLARHDPSVSVYLDGILLPKADGQLMDTVDLDSVQVLRGPQGTLFGKNNTGGALIFTLTKPSEESSYYVEAGLGNYNLRRFRVGGNYPISDTFFVRGAVNTVRDEGYLYDTSVGRNASNDRMSALAQLRWLASETMTLDTLLYYGKVSERLPSYHCSIVNEGALLVNGLGLLWSGDTDPTNPQAYADNCNKNSIENQPDLTTSMGPDQKQNRSLDTHMLGSTLSWELNEDTEFKAILGVRNAYKPDSNTVSDEGGAQPYLRVQQLAGGKQESMSVEFQLNGTLAESRLDYTAGLFYMTDRKYEEGVASLPLVGVEAATLAQLAVGMSPSLRTSTAPLVAALLPMDHYQEFDLTGQTYAIFSQVTWNITDNLELTFGGRYTEEARRSKLLTRFTDNAAVSAILSSDPRFTTIDPALGLHAFAGTWGMDPVGLANEYFPFKSEGSSNTPLGEPIYDDNEKTFREFTPMASLAWIVPQELLGNSMFDSLMAYGTWSNGFKTGFLEPVGGDGLVVIEPELLENIELGLKSEFLDRSLRLNLAVYSMVFEGMQLITSGVDSVGTLVVTTQNAGESTIKGVEAELTWMVTADTVVNFSFSDNNYEFVEFEDRDFRTLATTGEVRTLDRSDEDFAVTPDTTASLGVQHSFHSDIGTITTRLDANYKSKVYMGFDNGAWDAAQENPDAVYDGAYSLVDARVTWWNNDHDTSFAFYVKNVNDKRYLVGAVANGDSVGTFGAALGPPRTYGIEVFKRY
jgi:iron complex outermembrane receptor protein